GCRIARAHRLPREGQFVETCYSSPLGSLTESSTTFLGDTMTTEAWIIDAARTPRGIGKVDRGSLAHLHPQHLSATVLNALKERNGIRTEEVDDVIWGCSTQRGKQWFCIGRMSLLAAGWDTRASGVTLDRF